MRRLLLACGLAAAVPGGALAQQTEAAEFTVAGIPVILKPITANEVITVRLYLKGGSANLTPATAGIERFIGALASHGTAKYSKDEFAARATAAGIELSTNAAKDYTVMSVRGVREHWEETWDLFTQAVLHPTFPENELALVRDQILNDLRQQEDDPDTYLFHLGDSVLYAGHAYASDAEGTVAAITALRREDLVRWHRERLTRENLLLVVVGNISRADLERKIVAAFGALRARGRPAVAVQPVGPGAAQVKLVPRELPTNYVLGVFPTPSPADSDYAALRVGIDILSDRLFEEVRTKRNLSYAVFAGLRDLRANHGFVYVTAVDPDTTLKVMFHELRRLQHEPIAAERLAENVNTFLTRYFLRQEANTDQAAILGTYELSGGGWERAGSFIERVRAVTAADIQRVARQYLMQIRFVVIGDSTKVDRALFTSM